MSDTLLLTSKGREPPLRPGLRCTSLLLLASGLVAAPAAGGSRPPDDWHASTGKNPSVSVSFASIHTNGRWLIGDKNKPNRGRFHYAVTSKPTGLRIRLEVGITKYLSEHEDVRSERAFIRHAPYATKINCRMPCSLSIMAQAWPKDYYMKPWHGKITLKVWID